MVVAIIALVFAVSGTAVAAGGLLNGDKVIKRGSLSGNRLRKHTVTGTQINLNQLGKVPSASNADHATAANTALTANTASNATNAGNAATVGGQSPGAFDSAANWTRSGMVSVPLGTTNRKLATFGPFTLNGSCSGTAGHPDATMTFSTSEGNVAINGGTYPTPQTNQVLLDTGVQTGADDDGGTIVDFVSGSGKGYEGQLDLGTDLAGSDTCFFTALVGAS